MGQLLLIQAGPGRTTAPVLDAALACYREIAGLAPADQWTSERAAAVVFARVNGTFQPIRRVGQSIGCLAAAGTWTCPGAADPLAAVESRLATEGGFEAAVRDSDGLFLVARAGPGTIACGTDAGGRLHAYSAEVDGCLVIATSALVLARMTGAGLDPEACAEMLGSGSVFEGRSLFAGIAKLEPGTIFELRDGRIASRRRWWDVASVLSAGTDRPESDVPALARALEGAVARALAAAPRPIVDLTGGFDSRAIVGAALASGRPFQTVVNGADEDGDVRSARGIATRFGLGLLRLRPGIDYGTRSLAAIERAIALTDGEFDGVEYADILEIHERLARQGDETVNGSAGELCRGYWWDLVSGGRLDVGRAARRFVPDDWADAMTAAPGATPLARRFEDVIRRANAGLEGLPGTALADNVYLVLRVQRWAGRLASATDRIWPCVSPFMSRAPLEVALTAPVAARARNRMARRSLAHLNPALAALPMAGGYPASPIGVANALRFLPLARETAAKAAGRLRRALGRPAAGAAGPSVVADLWAREDVREILDPGRMRTAPIYRDGALSAFLRDSQAPGFPAGRKFGRVLTLELVALALARAPRGRAGVR